MRKKPLISTILVLAVIIFALFILVFKNQISIKNPSSNSEPGTTTVAPQPLPDLNNWAPLGPGQEAGLKADGGRVLPTSSVPVLAPSGALSSSTPESLAAKLPPQIDLQRVKQENTGSVALPAGTIKIEVSAAGFSPRNFSVKAGQAVKLAISSVDAYTHVLLFTNPALIPLTTMVLEKETKLIEFTAPAAGAYFFRDDLPDFRANNGEMIVE